MNNRLQEFYTIIEDPIFFKKSVVFKVPLQSGAHVYMSMENQSRGDYIDPKWVVIVNPDKFLNAWKQEPYSPFSELSYGNTQTWQSDRKYGLAQQGFSYGKNNPVPLAYVHGKRHTKRKLKYERKFVFLKRLISISETEVEYISFTNGVTRTIWLLANKAIWFPVSCSNKTEAGIIANISGYNTDCYESINNLFNIK